MNHVRRAPRSRASTRPGAKKLFHAIFEPGQVPFVAPVDGHGCNSRNARRALELRRMRPLGESGGSEFEASGRYRDVSISHASTTERPTFAGNRTPHAASRHHSCNRSQLRPRHAAIPAVEIEACVSGDADLRSWKDDIDLENGRLIGTR